MAASNLDDVLHRVAAGELSPEDALRLLDTAGGADGPGGPDLLHEPPAAPGGTPDPQPGTNGDVREARLALAYADVTVIADASVAQVHVSGRHTVRRDGHTLEVTSDGAPWADGEGSRFSFSALPRTVDWVRGWGVHSLTVRVNPQLPLELDATGCALKVLGPEAGARMRMIACSARFERLRGPLTLDAMTSSVKGSFGPTGTSTLSFEQCSARLSLLPGADLRLRATNRMGRLVLPGGVHRSVGPGPETSTTTLGGGRDELAVDALMSTVVLRTGSDRSGR